MANVPGAVADLSRVQAEAMHYTSDGASIEAYYARPLGEGPFPGIIVIHEAFGMVEHIRDLARRFANQGYLAIAPNLYSRGGSPDPNNMEDVFPKMLGLSDAQVVRDLEAAATVIRADRASNGRVGVIGFCSGGRQTLLMACSSHQVDAAIDCWGGFIRRATPNDVTTPSRPRPIVDMVDHLHGPLLVVIGAEDQNPSPEDGEYLKSRLQAAGKSFEYRVYANAGHAFLADYRPQYREAAAFALWDDILRFFGQHLRS